MSSYFNNFFKRVSDAVGISTFTDLSKILDVNRSAVTQARKKRFRTGHLAAVAFQKLWS